jgi:DNA-binding transcriptional LysR family regulator
VLCTFSTGREGNDLDINKYLLFADVAETRNFTKSGERMGYTQPGVSHILKSLENELDFSLFIRTKQGVSLTPNAELILPLVRNLLAINENLEQTINSLNGLEKGRLKIATFASVSIQWLPTIIHKFQQDYPGIDIDLMEGGTDDIVSWVENNVVDFGFLSKRHTKSLEWISLYEDPLMAILPKDHPAPLDEPYPISKMDGKSFIISAVGTDYDVHHALKEIGIKPSIHFSSKDDHAIVSMVANDLGVSILPKLVIKDFVHQIKALPLEPYFSRDLGIGVRSVDNMTPAATRFIEYTKELIPNLI